MNEMLSIMHSKRANIFYLEKCKVMVKDNRVVFLTEDVKRDNYWNIPIANTTTIILCNGTSITNSAVSMLAKAGVLIGFSGAGGTPLYAGTEVEWITPQNEYRPTEYVQKWFKLWANDEERLIAAKKIQKLRVEYIEKIWSSDKEMISSGFYTDERDFEKAVKKFNDKIYSSIDVSNLLLAEANFTKDLYKISAKICRINDFTRNHEPNDITNFFLNQGNYLAYGIAASTLWVLGIPHGFALFHGKTRKGALVFDIADLIKDAIVLPLSFISSSENIKKQDFKNRCLEKFIKHKSMDYMFDSIKKIIYGDL
jgi:CRISPR-associated protein Cas1